MSPTILLSLLIAAAPTKADAAKKPKESKSADTVDSQEPPAQTEPQPAVTEPAHVSAEVDRYPVHIIIDTHELLLEQAAEIVAETDDAFSRDMLSLFANDVDIKRKADPQAVTFKISLWWVDYKKSVYGVKISATRPDGVSRADNFELTGEYYNVIEKIEANAPEYLEWFERGEEPEGPPPQVDPPPGPKDPPGGETKPQPYKHTLRWVGVGVGAVGLAAGVAGAVLFTRIEDQLVFEGGTRNIEQVRTYGNIVPPVLMGVGGAALVTGVVLIVIDAKRAKAARQSKTSVTPAVTHNHVGLSLTGRF